MEIQQLAFWLFLWVFTIALVFFVRWQRKVAGSGLVFAYLFNFSLIHFFGACVYALPWYNYDYLSKWYQGYNFGWVEKGFRLSTYGIMAFAFGALFMAPFLMNFFQLQQRVIPTRIADSRLPKAYIMMGFLGYFFLSPLLGGVPTLVSILSSSLNLLLVGFSLTLWRAWQEKKPRTFTRWLFFSLLGPPFLTLVGKGFLGYGVGVFIALAAFLASFYRPRIRVVIAGLFMIYLGLSTFVTYMRDRALIREAVWEGESIANRIEQLYRTVSSFEWFNPYNEFHLIRIDMRLNQNFLVGAAAEALAETKDFAKGQTIIDSLIALIPRALWPDKPLKAGSPGLVTRFTGISFAEGTSVGIGQVMEFYVNFGLVGVILGFLFMGVIVAVFDLFAKERLVKGDWQGFTFWFLPGLSLLQVGGSLVEITASVGGAMAMAVLVNQILQRFRGRKVPSLPIPSPSLPHFQ